MVIFSGYGLVIVLMDYFGGIFLLSKLSPYLFTTEKQQYLALIAFQVIITFINYYLAMVVHVRKKIGDGLEKTMAGRLWLTVRLK